MIAAYNDKIIESSLQFIFKSLHHDLSLQVLASQANYSPYHFHRLFTAQVGETPKAYIIRLRLEKSVKDLVLFPQKPIYEIALDNGFSSQATFARAFKQKYQVSAQVYRDITLRKINEDILSILPYAQLEKEVARVSLNNSVLVTQLTYSKNEKDIMRAFISLYQWAEAEELTNSSTAFFGILLDSPFNTPFPKCRYLAGISLAENRKNRKMDYICLPGGNHLHLSLQGNFINLAINILHIKKQYLPESAYQIKSDAYVFEKIEKIEFEKPYSQHQRQVYIPIQSK